MNEDQLRAALLAESAADRRFTLAQIATSHGSARWSRRSISTRSRSDTLLRASIDQAQELALLGDVIPQDHRGQPARVFLIEGAIPTQSDRMPPIWRCRTGGRNPWPLALSEYFDVPPGKSGGAGLWRAVLKINRDGDIS